MMVELYSCLKEPFCKFYGSVCSCLISKGILLLFVFFNTSVFSSIVIGFELYIIFVLGITKLTVGQTSSGFKGT